MSSYNYIVTTQNPTCVSHSCVGKFTGPEDNNLIIGKCTHIEVYSIEGHPQMISSVPVQGRIKTLELFRPRGETQDLLLLATHQNKFSFLRWDPDAAGLVTREFCDISGILDDFSDMSGTLHGTSSSSSSEDTTSSSEDTPADTLKTVRNTSASGQAIIIDPDCKMIGLHTYEPDIKIVPLGDKGQLKKPFKLTFGKSTQLSVLDIKFLYGCKNPTIVVLYQPPPGSSVWRCLRSFEILVEDERFVEAPWRHDIEDDFHSADLLIPVPPPWCGVLVIGEYDSAYCGLSRFVKTDLEPPITRSYQYRLAGFDCATLWDEDGYALKTMSSSHFDLAHTRVDVDGALRFILGDHAGKLYSIGLAFHNTRGVCGLEIKLVGETSRASTISFLDNGLMYVGSMYADSQLIQLNHLVDIAAANLQVLERYMNIGPIGDVCMAHDEKKGQVAIVTCSKTDEAGSIRIIKKDTDLKINKQASVNVESVQGMWSVRRTGTGTDDGCLVVSYLNETFILASINVEGGVEHSLENTEIEGFALKEKTVFCRDVKDNQIVQVTSNGVRLLSLTSRKLADEWRPPFDYTINAATANDTQVLLATSGGELHYLEISNGSLLAINNIKKRHAVSCLHIKSGGEMAAVGSWALKKASVKILSLPDLKTKTKELLISECFRPCSVLFCVLEEIWYVFCVLADGELHHLELSEDLKLKKVSVGTGALSVEAISHKDRPHVFIVSDGEVQKLIHSSNNRLRYTEVLLGNIRLMCPFRCGDYPNSFAFIEGEGGFNGVEDIKEERLTIGTLAEDPQSLKIRSVVIGEPVRSIAQQRKSNTFAITTRRSVNLLNDETFEMLSTYQLDEGDEFSSSVVMLSGDEMEFCCVGTEEGRVVVLVVNNGILELVDGGSHSNGGIHGLGVYQDRLFAVSDYKLLVLDWIILGGRRQLQVQYQYDFPVREFSLHISGDWILTYAEDMRLIMYKLENGELKEQGRDDDNRMISACVFDGIYSGSTFDSRLVTTYRECHIDDAVNVLRKGSLVYESHFSQIPTLIYGTESGAIGTLVALPEAQFSFMDTTFKKA